MYRILAALILVFTLAACATLFKSPLQEVYVTTPGAPGSRCAIRNHYFLYIINPPRRFNIERTQEPYMITCWAPGNRQKTAVMPVGYEKTANWNVANGYLPGASVDLSTGAMFRYPDQVVIDFRGMKPEPMPLPDYQKMLDENPLIKGMEAFRPGQAALSSDEGVTVVPLQKRSPGSYDDSFGLLSVSPDSGNGTNNSGSSSSYGVPSGGTPNAPGTNGTLPVSPFSSPTTAPARGGSTTTTTTTTSSTSSTGTGLMRHGLPDWNKPSTGSTSTAPASTSTTVP